MDHGIAKALLDGACEKNLNDQFDRLILQPLRSPTYAHSTNEVAVLIIDALDECENASDVRLILTILARAVAIKSPRLRIFVTSRPELPVELGFRKMDGESHQDARLEEVQDATIAHDIREHFLNQSGEIKGHDWTFDPLPADWPWENNIEMLVDLAMVLLIFAFTICRYIAEEDP